jgi:4'-phosphopantetheinyl transferase
MNEEFPQPGMPPEMTIDVWRIDLDRPLEIAVNLGDILSDEERARAERFVFARDASRFQLCRAMLRVGLGWYLGRVPSRIALTTGWRGKPGLAEPCGLYFNVSHCERLALIAFTTVGEIGIDVEAFQRDVEALEIATADFTAVEAAMIAAAGTRQEQISIFLRLWTRKEAVLKAAGGGLLDGLNSADVSRDPPGVVRLGKDAGGESRWLVRDLGGIDGFAGAVAAPPGGWPGQEWSIREWPIRCEDALHRLAARFPDGL